jgi:hypothetical protein
MIKWSVGWMAHRQHQTSMSMQVAAAKTAQKGLCREALRRASGQAQQCLRECAEPVPLLGRPVWCREYHRTTIAVNRALYLE